MRGKTLPFGFYFFDEYRYITYPGIKPNIYGISEYGHIVNYQRNIQVSQFLDRYGYVTAYLQRDGQTKCSFERVHRLVAWEFCPNRDLSLDVNHIDGNKQNNHYTNLEWVNRSDNNTHALLNGLRPALFNINELHEICRLLQDTDLKYREILHLIGREEVNPNAISDIKMHKYWTAVSNQYDFSHRK